MGGREGERGTLRERPGSPGRAWKVGRPPGIPFLLAFCIDMHLSISTPRRENK